MEPKQDFLFFFPPVVGLLSRGSCFDSFCFIHTSLGNHAEMALLSKTVESVKMCCLSRMDRKVVFSTPFPFYREGILKLTRINFIIFLRVRLSAF